MGKKSYLTNCKYIRITPVILVRITLLPCQGKTPYLHFWQNIFCILNFLIIEFFVLPKKICLIKIRPSLIYTVYLLPFMVNWGPLSRQNAVSAHIRRFALRSHVDTAFCLDCTSRYGFLSQHFYAPSPPPPQWLRHGGGQHK